MAPAELKVDVELPSRNVQLELGLEGDKWDKQGAKDRVLRARLAKGSQQRACQKAGRGVGSISQRGQEKGR